jgi:hypothetical protein
MQPRVTIAFPGVGDVACRVLDSSDGLERANVHLQEVLLWSTYIQRFHELYFPRAEPRDELLEMAALMAMPTLMEHGLDAEEAEDAGRELADEVVDRILPADIGEARHPGATTFERLAQAMEYRRQALRKLLAATAQDASKEQVDTMVDACRNWDLALQVLDALITGESPDEDTDSEDGDGPDRSPDPETRGGESPATPASGTGCGQPDMRPAGHSGGDADGAEPGPALGSRDLAEADPAGTVDHGRDAGPPGGPAHRRGTETTEDAVRSGDAPQSPGTEELAGDLPEDEHPKKGR